MRDYCQDIPYTNTSQTLQINCKVGLYMESLSELLQRRMTELDLNKSKLAEMVGVSRAYIGDLANGTAKTKSGIYRPKPEIIAGLAKALKVSESEILNSLGHNIKNTSESRKPRTPAELFEILDDLGLDIQLDGGIKTLEALDEDDLQELLDSVVANAVAKARRKSKVTGDKINL